LPPAVHAPYPHGALAWIRLAEMSLRLRPLDARLQAEWPELATTLPGGLAGGLDGAIRRLAREVTAIDETRRLWTELWLPELRHRPIRGEMPSWPPTH
jgi:hypothetical protein